MLEQNSSLFGAQTPTFLLLYQTTAQEGNEEMSEEILNSSKKQQTTTRVILKIRMTLRITVSSGCVGTLVYCCGPLCP